MTSNLLYTPLIVSDNSYRTRVGHKIQRQCRKGASYDNLEFSRQEETALFKTSQHCKFIWDRKVPYGRSTCDGDSHSAHVSPSIYEPR